MNCARSKTFSLRELAGKIGVSAAFMSDVELNRRYPSDKHLREIAQYLGTGVGGPSAIRHPPSSAGTPQGGAL